MAKSKKRKSRRMKRALAVCKVGKRGKLIKSSCHKIRRHKKKRR